jgi:hypothetical protein
MIWEEGNGEGKDEDEGEGEGEGGRPIACGYMLVLSAEYSRTSRIF